MRPLLANRNSRCQSARRLLKTHIANATIEQRLRNLATAAGFTLPVICTPEELMENDNEQSD